MKRTPARPVSTNAVASCARPQAENNRNPNASPAKAKATQGNTGKSQGCGAPRLCTPLTYDSTYQGSQPGRCVVQRGGVASANRAAAAIAEPTYLRRDTALGASVVA